MISFLKNFSILKLSIIIYLFLISLLYFYYPELFNTNSISKIAWLITISSILSYMISKKCF
jgi:hypothetical protein